MEFSWADRVAISRANRWLKSNGVNVRPPRHVMEKIRRTLEIAKEVNRDKQD